jgi:hypothetical protein
VSVAAISSGNAHILYRMVGVRSKKTAALRFFVGEPGNLHVALRGVRRIMHVLFQPPQPRGLVGKSVQRLLDGNEFGADGGNDAGMALQVASDR